MRELIIIFCVNTICSLAFFIFKYRRPERSLALLFAVLPLFGFLTYYLPLLFHRITGRKNQFSDGDIRRLETQDQHVYRPQVEQELNLVSLDEALSISNISERRAYLLGILKNSMFENSALVHSALSDPDSETSHYAAAATFEVYKRLKKNIQEIEAAFSADRENVKLRRELIDAYDEYLKSGVLTSRDYRVCLHKMIAILQESVDTYEDILTDEDYLNLVSYLAESDGQNIQKSIATAELAKERFNTEQCYLKLLEMYHKTGNKNKFTQVLNEFRQSDVTISNTGLEFIRFWQRRSCDASE